MKIQPNSGNPKSMHNVFTMARVVKELKVIEAIHNWKPITFRISNKLIGVN